MWIKQLESESDAHQFFHLKREILKLSLCSYNVALIEIHKITSSSRPRKCEICKSGGRDNVEFFAEESASNLHISIDSFSYIVNSNWTSSLCYCGTERNVELNNWVFWLTAIPAFNLIALHSIDQKLIALCQFGAGRQRAERSWFASLSASHTLVIVSCQLFFQYLNKSKLKL